MEITFEKLLQEIITNYKQRKRIILFNIGSSKINGDSFGPIFGTILKKKHLKNIKILGSLDESINALNIKEYYKKINENDFIISTDACKLKKNRKSNFIISNDPIYPGTGVGKELGNIGDYSIKFFIKDSQKDEFDIFNMCQYDLKNVHAVIENLVDFFVGVDKILNYIKKEKK